MSRWDGPRWPPRTAKKPPPAEGIKLKKAGTTWWGQRWIGALELVLRGDAGRLARGRTYARAGRTHDLEVRDGAVTAKVTGSRSTPYAVRIELALLSAEQWSAAVTALAEKAQFAAELLAGQMPQNIDDVFVSAGSSLFPQRRADLKTSCSCPDWGDPCKHVAATHYVLGEALDRDPFLLFELRGQTKAQVLTALRAARGGEPTPNEPGPHAESPFVVQSVTLGELSAHDYDAPRAALPLLQLSFDAPGSHAAVLRQLGTPAAWGSKESPADVFAPLLQAAADKARQIALAEPEAEAAASQEESGLSTLAREDAPRVDAPTRSAPSAGSTRSKQRAKKPPEAKPKRARSTRRT